MNYAYTLECTSCCLVHIFLTVQFKDTGNNASIRNEYPVGIGLEEKLQNDSFRPLQYNIMSVCSLFCRVHLGIILK